MTSGRDKVERRKPLQGVELPRSPRGVLVGSAVRTSITLPSHSHVPLDSSTKRPRFAAWTHSLIIHPPTVLKLLFKKYYYFVGSGQWPRNCFCFNVDLTFSKFSSHQATPPLTWPVTEKGQAAPRTLPIRFRDVVID